MQHYHIEARFKSIESFPLIVYIADYITYILLCIFVRLMCRSGPPDKYVKFAHYEEVLLLYLRCVKIPMFDQTYLGHNAFLKINTPRQNLSP